MQTKDTDLLFQTSDQLDETSRRKKKVAAAALLGSPINVNSKILHVHVQGNDAWLAESGWQARRVDLTAKTGETKQTYKPHQGPVTFVTLAQLRIHGVDVEAVFTCSWDKLIRIWDADSGVLLCTLAGHTDFVKSLAIIPLSPPLLLSTSSDRTVRLWKLEDLGQLPAEDEKQRCIQTIRDHTRPVECSAVRLSESGSLQIWTADSLGVIKEWIITDGRMSHVKDLAGHHTSVVSLMPVEEGLWSTSMDKRAILHMAQGAVASLQHPSYVKSLAILDHGSTRLVLTGCSDEEIRVWDGDLAAEGEARLLAIVPGHSDEVSSLAISDRRLISGGLDGTLRRWNTEELLHPRPLDDEASSGPPGVELSAEEEAELAALMEDDI